MSMILLADDSPHAQRMGEHILREEGFDVSCVRDGVAAMIRIAEIDPDLVIADAFLPGRNGFDLCRQLKRWRPHVRVILTAGQLESFDEEAARDAGCDAVLRKPFEASQAVAIIRPLVQEAILERGLMGQSVPPPESLALPVSDAIHTATAASHTPDPERVKAAVEAALQNAIPSLVRDITEKVLIALGN
ncbi:MAG: response regulator [Acidobacteriota bacterium]